MKKNKHNERTVVKNEQAGKKEEKYERKKEKMRKKSTKSVKILEQAYDENLTRNSATSRITKIPKKRAKKR